MQQDPSLMQNNNIPSSFYDCESISKMNGSVVIDNFPWTVIESLRESFFSQSKVEMRVASLEQGGARYGGPEGVCEEQWKHTEFFYILEPVELGCYIAQSLNDRFHYQIL
jgi:hypothetical protein